jgi:hypothetical protein
MIGAGPLQLSLGLLGAARAGGASVTCGRDLGFPASRSPAWSRVASWRTCFLSLACPSALHASWDQIDALDAPADGKAVLDVR